MLTNAIVVHLICDWIFQNQWMAQNKIDLLHPASVVHAGIHFVGMLTLMSWQYALLIAVTHALIDTRIPFKLWESHWGKSNNTMYETNVQIWVDQVFHIVILFVVVNFLI